MKAGGWQRLSQTTSGPTRVYGATKERSFSLINRETVIVVGAGASADLGLPLGDQLKDHVSNLFVGTDSDLYPFFEAAIAKLAEAKGFNANDAVKSMKNHADGIRSAASIDNYMDQYKNDEAFVNAAKLAIAYSIADAEKKSKLKGRKPPGQFILENKEYFLYDFLNIVVRGHQKENICESLTNLTFVIFNYDRCVERFIDLWMKMRFGPNFSWRATGPKFIHVYGSLGDYFDDKLPKPFERENAYPFQNPHLDLPQYADMIKVFTEQEDSAVKVEIESALTKARALLFLGFGFEEQNMRFFANNPKRALTFATLYGMSEPNTKYLREYLAKRFCRGLQDQVGTVNGKCGKLLSDFYHPLTSAVGSI